MCKSLFGCDPSESRCQHTSDPKPTRLTPSLRRPRVNERKRQVLAREVYNEEAILVAADQGPPRPGAMLREAPRNAAGIRSQEGKERGRRWGSDSMKDGRLSGSDGREGREEGDMGDPEQTLSPLGITNHTGKHNVACTAKLISRFPLPLEETAS